MSIDVIMRKQLKSWINYFVKLQGQDLIISEVFIMPSPSLIRPELKLRKLTNCSELV